MIVLGQAGDRTDEALKALARSAWELNPERIILKELGKYRRGRPEGQVCQVLEAELHALGVRPDQIERVETEVDAARSALAWAEAGDLLILLVHEKRDQVTALLDEIRRSSWRVGTEVP